MDFSFWCDTINMGPHVINSKLKLYFFLSVKIVFVLVNSANPDEMPHYVAFHLGLHCLPQNAFRSHYYMYV